MTLIQFGKMRIKIKILLCSLCAVFIVGCGGGVNEFFDKKTTEIHSKSIVREVSRIPVIPEVNNPLPDLYLADPEIVTLGQNDTKLYYFTRNHTPEKLETLVKEQLGFPTSSNAATNQLVVKCKTIEESQTALQFLEKVDVPPIQVRIDCLISEIFADVTLDWETSLEIQDLFGIGSSTSKTVGSTLIEGIALLGGGSNNQAFLGASARDAARSNQGLQIGVASSDFGALVDLLASRGYLKIVMNPTLRSVNGKSAKIITTDNVPITEFVEVDDAGHAISVTKYKQIVDSLEVTPQVYADGSIGLLTKAVIGSKSTPEGASQRPIITSREIQMEENRIRPGDSLIVGGIRKSEDYGVVRGVPFLEDLPLIGVMFSSKDREEKVREILFILTPTISSTGEDYEAMMARIRQKHKKPEVPKGIVEQIIDPFDSSEYTHHIEQKAELSEAARVRAEMLMAQSREESNKKWAEAEKVKAEAEKIQAEANKTKAEAEKAQAEADKEKAEAEKMKAQAQKAKAEAEKAKAEAQRAKIEADNRPCPAIEPNQP